MSDEQPMNLWQRIREAALSLDKLVKAGVAPEKAGGWAFVSHDDVTEAVRNVLFANGVCVSISAGDHHIERWETVTDRSYTKITFGASVSVSVTFINVDAPAERETTTMPAFGLDLSDKATGKAISYGVKYALLKNFLLPTGEDVDGSNVTVEQPKKRQIQAQREVKPKVNGEQLNLKNYAWGLVRDLVGAKEPPTKAQKKQMVDGLNRIVDAIDIQPPVDSPAKWQKVIAYIEQGIASKAGADEILRMPKKEAGA